MILYYLRRNLPQTRPHAVFIFFKSHLHFPPPPPRPKKKKQTENCHEYFSLHES